MVVSDSNVILNYQRTIGMTTMDLGGKGFYYPNDSAFTSDGKIYVLNRSLEAGGGGRGMRVTICDVADEFHGDWGKFGSGIGELMWRSTTYPILPARSAHAANPTCIGLITSGRDGSRSRMV